MSDQEQELQQDSSNAIIPENNPPEVRRIWHNNEWYYAVVDFIKIWTESDEQAVL